MLDREDFIDRCAETFRAYAKLDRLIHKADEARDAVLASEDLTVEAAEEIDVDAEEMCQLLFKAVQQSEIGHDHPVVLIVTEAVRQYHLDALAAHARLN